MAARKLAALGGLLVVAGVLAACAGPAAQAPPQAPAASTGPGTPGGPAPAGGPSAANATSAGAVPAAGGTASRPRESLLFSIPSRNLNYIVPMAAKSLGFFDEAGLDLQIEAIAPNLTVAAMQRGDVKLTGTGGSTIRAAVRGEAPFTLVAFMTERPTYYVITRPELRTPVDLVGKRIGVASLGDTPSIFTENWLRQRGVDPSEVLFTGLGPNPAVHLSALQAGAIDGAVFDPASAAVAETSGFRLLQALGEAEPGPQQGIVATNELLQSSPATVRAFLKGLVRGLRYSKDHVRELAVIAQQELGLEMDDATATRAVQLYLDGVSAQTPGYADAKELEAFYQFDVRLPLELPPEQPIPTVHDFRYLLEVYDELGIARPR